MDKLSIKLVQTHLEWESPDANLAKLEEMLEQDTVPGDLIVLPEMFATGFTTNVSLAEVGNGRSLRWMKLIAQRYNCAVAGSIIAKEKASFFNRLFWVEPDGAVRHYDKRHLFRQGSREHEVFMAGSDPLVVNWKGWKIAPFICYDIRFPVWSRNRLLKDGSMRYDLMLYVAAWPKTRQEVWETLLKARAIENQAYCVGVNRVGHDDNGAIQYAGGSKAVDPTGKVMLSLGDMETVQTLTLTKASLEECRDKFPAYLDADSFVIKTDEK
ncbi:MAG: amidohydrolase [Cytophagales bacterium]|nr:amidohydrolase [Cytophagales bacterium]